MPYSPLAAGHLARPKWWDSVRGKTGQVAVGKYDRMEQQDILVVQRVQELAKLHQRTMSQIAIAWQWAKTPLLTRPSSAQRKVRYLDDAAGAFPGCRLH